MPDLIDSLYSPKWFEDQERTIELLKQQEAAIAAVNAVIKEGASQAKNARTVDDYAAAQKKLTDATQQSEAAFEKRRLSEIKLQQQREKAFDDYEKKLQKQISDNEKATARAVALAEKEAKAKQKAADDAVKAAERTQKAAEKASAANAAAAAKEAKAIEGLANDYELLKRAQIDAADKAKNIGTGFGINSQVFKAAAADAKKLSDVLLGIESAVGQNQRNVGNYKSGFSGLGASIQQILREAPSAAVSLNTFFLAISNNLPQFFDEVQKINKAQKEANLILKEQIVIQREAAAAQAIATGATQEIADAAADLAEETLKANAAEAKAPSLLQQIGKSLFSVNTFLTLAVLALTLFGGKIVDFVKDLFKGNASLNELKASLELLNKAFKSTEFTKAVEQINELRINVDLAKKGFLDQDKVVHQYNETIGQTAGEVKNLSDVESFLVKNADAYIKMILYKTAATLSLNEAAKKLIENQNAMDKATNTQDFFKKGADSAQDDEAQRAMRFRERQAGIRVASLQKQSDKELEIVKKFQEKAAAIAKKNKFDFFGGTQDEQDEKEKKPTDFTNAELKSEQDYTKELYSEISKRTDTEAEAQKFIADDDKRILADRLAAYRKYVQLHFQAQAGSLSAEYDETQTALDKIAVIENKPAKDRTKQENELVLRKQALTQKLATIDAQYSLLEQKTANESANGVTAIVKDAGEKQIKAKMEVVAALRAAEQADRDDDLRKNQQNYEAGLINYKTYKNREKEINEVSAAAEEEAVSKYLNKQLDDLSAQGIDVTTLRTALNAALKKLYDDDAKAYDDSAAKKAEATKAAHDLEVEFARQAITTIQALFDGAYDRQIQQEEDKVKAIATSQQAEIDAVNASVLSQEDKDKKISAINAQAAARTAQEQERENEIKRKKALADRAAAILQIIANTAVAETAALTYLTTPVTAALYPEIAELIAGIAALQIAAVLATPLPSFAVGTENAPEGVAKVHAGELVIPKVGKPSYISQDTYAYLTKGTVVKTAAATEELMKYYALGVPALREVPGRQYEMDKIMEGTASKIVSAIKGQRFPVQQSKPAWWDKYEYIHTK